MFRLYVVATKKKHSFDIGFEFFLAEFYFYHSFLDFAAHEMFCTLDRNCFWHLFFPVVKKPDRSQTSSQASLHHLQI